MLVLLFAGIFPPQSALFGAIGPLLLGFVAVEVVVGSWEVESPPSFVSVVFSIAFSGEGRNRADRVSEDPGGLLIRRKLWDGGEVGKVSLFSLRFCFHWK